MPVEAVGASASNASAQGVEKRAKGQERASEAQEKPEPRRNEQAEGRGRSIDTSA